MRCLLFVFSHVQVARDVGCLLVVPGSIDGIGLLAHDPGARLPIAFFCQTVTKKGVRDFGGTTFRELLT